MTIFKFFLFICCCLVEIACEDNQYETTTVATVQNPVEQQKLDSYSGNQPTPRIQPSSTMLRPNGGNIPDLDAIPIAWRWRSLRCWELDDAVPCNTDADCEYPCHWKWVKTFPIKCAGEPKYCMMNLAGFLPHWMLERFDGSQCCWKPEEPADEQQQTNDTDEEKRRKLRKMRNH